MVCFDNMLGFLSNSKLKSYVCLNSNINLLEIHNNAHALNYYNTITNNGYMLNNHKASRMQNNHNSLIDHILTNNNNGCKHSGSIIEDLSDHLITFIQLDMKKRKLKPNKVSRRLISIDNLTRFRDNLSNVRWDDVLNTDNVDDCYSVFWDKFKSLYDIHFPVVTSRFNRNYHKMSDFMTPGLMVSRRKKIDLLKISLAAPTEINKNTYKTYRNLYNKLIRIRKRDNITEQIEKIKKKQ
jgi:hypothetical protein